MKRMIRNTLITVGIAVGLIAASTGPAMAGVVLGNHSEPLNRR